MIYYCKTCGTYQDVALTQVLKDAWNNAMKSSPGARIPQGYPCPFGHGMLVQLQVGDRIRVESNDGQGESGESP